MLQKVKCSLCIAVKEEGDEKVVLGELEKESGSTWGGVTSNEGLSKAFGEKL
jgi:hypothetical protein